MYPVEEADSHLPAGNNGFEMGPPAGFVSQAVGRQQMPSMHGLAPEPYPQAQHSFNYDHQRVPHQPHARSRKSDS
jgi:hypothetical protein